MGVSKTHAKMIPAGIDPFNTKPEPLKDEFDEWLMRIVMFAFSLPPTAFVPDNNRATAQTTATLSKEEGLSALLDYVKNLINFIIITQFGYTDIEFKWDIEEETDPMIKAQIDQIYVQSGIKKVNEIRQEMGLDPLEEEPAEEQNPFEFETEADEEPDEADAEKLAKKKTLKQDISENKKVQAAQKGIEKILDAYFNLQRKHILNQLSNVSKAELPDNFDIEIDLPDAITKSFIEKIGAYLFNIGTVTVGYVLNALGINNKKVNDKSLKNINTYIKTRSAELIGKKVLPNGLIIDNPNAAFAITSTTRDGIKKLVDDAIKNGLSNQELAKNIEDSYLFSKERSLMIARTETNIADNELTVETYKAAGVEKKQWLTAQDDLVSEECMANEAAGAIGIDEDFPSGDSAPPCHPNCRCSIIAVFDEE